jgi:3-hydroxyacyl-[acyl-carrier-protein] dehydratase
MTFTAPLEAADIMRILPHRYPFLLVDRVLELEPGKRVVALKNVTVNEHYFQGHFPGHPVVPGVLLVEGLAQAGGLLLLHDLEGRDGKLLYFTSIEKARFRRPVVPGDQVRYEVEVIQKRARYAKLAGKVMVGDTLAADAVITSAMVDR